MQRVKRVIKSVSVLAMATLAIVSCKQTGNPTSMSPGGASTATGLAYNEEDGFQVAPYQGQPDGPNLVFIEGGRTVLASFEEDLLKTGDNTVRTVTIASFYILHSKHLTIL